MERYGYICMHIYVASYSDSDSYIAMLLKGLHVVCADVLD